MHNTSHKESSVISRTNTARLTAVTIAGIKGTRVHGGYMYLIAFVHKDEEEIKSGHDGSCHVDVLLEREEGKE